MKKLAFLFAVVFFASSFIFAQEEETTGGSVQDFKIVNHTGIIINNLYVAHASEEEWGDDLLGVDALEDGGEIEINFKGYGDDQCQFDILISDQEGNEFVLEDVNLCEIHELEFTSDNKKGK
jgi:hypothetical protein